MRQVLLTFAFAVPIGSLLMAISEDGSAFHLAANAIVFLSLLTTWIGSAIIRARFGLQGVWPIASFALLVLFGFLFGWMYVAIRGWSVPERG